MLAAIEKNLNRGVTLLNTISDVDYANQTVPPYFSSIGCHMRHVLDVFACILKGYKTGNIDLTIRERNELIEQKCELGIVYFDEIKRELNRLSSQDLSSKVTITDNLGLGKEVVSTTLAAALLQAQSHAIHHYASVGYIIHQLGIELPDADFGFNPTTPKQEVTN